MLNNSKSKYTMNCSVPIRLTALIDNYYNIYLIQLSWKTDITSSILISLTS